MKKLFAALVALCLMLTGVAALADEPTKVNWNDFEAQTAEGKGQFASVGNTGLMMYIPAQFKDTEVSKDAVAAGHFLALKSEDGKAIVTGQVVKKDIAQFRAAIEQQGYHTWDTIVNGISFVQFSVEAEGTVNTSFALPSTQNETILFSFAPANQEPYTGLFKLMAASLHAAK